LSEFRFNTRAEFNFRSAQCNVVEVFFAPVKSKRHGCDVDKPCNLAKGVTEQ